MTRKAPTRRVLATTALANVLAACVFAPPYATVRVVNNLEDRVVVVVSDPDDDAKATRYVAQPGELGVVLDKSAAFSGYVAVYDSDCQLVGVLQPGSGARTIVLDPGVPPTVADHGSLVGSPPRQVALRSTTLCP